MQPSISGSSSPSSPTGSECSLANNRDELFGLVDTDENLSKMGDIHPNASISLSPLSQSPNPSAEMPDAPENDANEKHKTSDLILIPNNCLSSSSSPVEDEKKPEQIIVNAKPEIPKKPDFLLNNPIRAGFFKLMPKSVSLCNEDKVFKQNFTNFFKKSMAVEQCDTVETTIHESVAVKRTKFRINQLSSRDVPTLINTFSANRFVPSFNFSSLERMESFKTHKAVSLDWESDLFEHRADVFSSSLTSFFQMAAKSGSSVKHIQAQIEGKHK
jgi:hypothetical protein